MLSSARLRVSLSLSEVRYSPSTTRVFTPTPSVCLFRAGRTLKKAAGTAAARKASMRGALGARARIPAASRTHGGAPSMRKKLCGWMIGERAARGACSAGVLCRAAGSGDDDDLDWEPDAEVRRGRRRGDGDRPGASLQIQRARPSTSYGPGYERDADYGGRWSRRRGRNAPPRGGLFSRESLQTDTGRRNALLTVLLGGATATVVFSDATTYSQFDCMSQTAPTIVPQEICSPPCLHRARVIRCSLEPLSTARPSRTRLTRSPTHACAYACDHQRTLWRRRWTSSFP